MRRLMLLLFGLALLASCSPNSTKIVAEYDDSQISLKEFEKAYVKNVGDSNKARISPLKNKKDFLDLYVNFKMKLRDAWVRGYYDDPDLNKEIDEYKKKVGATYIKEKELIEKGIRKLYNEGKWEYRVSHIMLRPNRGSGPDARVLAQKLINEIKSGKKSFEELVKEYSDDQYSVNDKGDIYWFAPGIVNYAFDKAITTTPVGKVYGKPVRTRYGYHIIKVTDKRKRIPEIKVRHILVRFVRPNGKLDSAAALKKIEDIKKQLSEGADFAKLAEKYSEDPGTAKKGGDLGYISRRMMVKPFDEAAFNLKHPGDISDIVKTRYGYHIIQLVEVPPFPSLEKVKSRLRKTYQRQRYNTEYKAFVDSLKKVYGFELNNSLVKIVSANKSKDYKFNDKIWDTPIAQILKDSVVFKVAGQPYYADSCFAFLTRHPDFQNKEINEDTFTRGVEKYAEEILLEHAAMGLEKRDPQFKELLDDYRNGIYIFKLQQEEVWNKMKIDTNAVKKYFEENRDKYKYPDRVEFSEIFTKKDSLAQKYYEEIKNGADFEELAKKFTERVGYKKRAGHFDLTDVKANMMAHEAWKLKNPGDISKPFPVRGGYSIVKLIKKVPSRLKTYEEAKAEVMSDYQEKLSKDLENAYIESLKKRYKPKYYYDVLKEAFKNTKI